MAFESAVTLPISSIAVLSGFMPRLYHDREDMRKRNVSRLTNVFGYGGSIDPMPNIGERLVKARDFAGLTQEQLAAKAGVSQGTIGNIEAGIRKKPREIVAIARACGVSADWLANGKGTMVAPPPNRDNEMTAWPFESFSKERFDRLTERQKGAVEWAALQALQQQEAAAAAVAPSGKRRDV